MRYSIAFSIVILAIAAALGWRLDQRLATARTLSGKLGSEAARSGISIDASNSLNPLGISKRQRTAGDDPVRLAAEFISLGKDLKILGDSGAKEDITLSERSADLRKRMELLDFDQAKIFIEELEANGSLAEYDCQKAIYSLLKDLGADRPQAVLALLADSSELRSNCDANSLIKNAVHFWAKENPHGALDWIQKNSGLFPEKDTGTLDWLKRRVICSAAITDPQLAFEVLGRSGLEDETMAAAMLMRSPRTAESRNAAIAAFREFLAKIEDVIARNDAGIRGMRALTPSIAEEGFVSASQWLADANLTPDELESIADDLSNYAEVSEIAQWIDWVAETLPPDKAEDVIWSDVVQWTQKDHQAAGEWLVAEPDGPTKNTAIKAYVRIVADIEPETAVQWAMTLPPGKDRNRAIRDIHRYWPEDDREGAAAFAKEHGIK